MKNIFKYCFLVLAAIGFAVGGLYFGHLVENKSLAPGKQSAATTNIAPDNSSQPVSAVQPENQTINSPVPAKAKIVPPMDNFNGRISLNGFGNQPSKMQVDESKYTDLVCSGGKNYPGYHTAVDLEVTANERDVPVSVFSITDGVVRQAGTVSGYGGLVVVEYTINGQIYTVYYGHTNIRTFTVKSGDKVTAGQKLAELAPACTPNNGNTRKHLHFGMHKGKSVVVSGYVNTKAELSGWIDPREIVK